MGPRGRLIFGLAGGCALAAATVVGTACITPPPEWVDPPPKRPVILDEQLQPPLTQILSSPPASFTVWLALSDPQETFRYAVFVDYNASLDTPPAESGGGIPSSTEVSFTFPSPPVLADGNCHSVEVLVVHDFATLLDGAVLRHTPDAVGGDEAIWFIVPAGSPDTCPWFDGGLPPRDASSEANAP
jgi:hypothetical protein